MDRPHVRDDVFRMLVMPRQVADYQSGFEADVVDGGSLDVAGMPIHHPNGPS